MNSLAASCSKRKRSRMLLLVSIRMAMRSGQIAFGVELGDFLSLLVLEDLEVFLDEVRDEAALLVGDREEHGDAGHVDLDAGWLIGLRRRDGLGRILAPRARVQAHLWRPLAPRVSYVLIIPGGGRGRV